MKKETQQNKEDKPSRAKKKKSRTSQSHMKFFSKKKKNPTLTMKLWTNSAWDCLAVGQTDRKSNNKGLE